MSKLNVVIIEDEIPAARLLSSMVGRLRPEWEMTVLPGNVEEAVQWFGENPHPDIIFLDIQLSDGNSFDFLSQAKPTSMIIFTTAYDEYAIRAFSVNSIDYILKPVDEQRLLEAIIKYESLAGNRRGGFDEYLNTVLDSLQQREKRFRTRFLISGADCFLTLQVADIAYFYSENKITFAVTGAGKEYIVDPALDKLSEQLDPDLFFRANRQVLLSVDAIKSVEPYFNGKVVVHVKPTFKEQIIISKEKIPSFKVWLNF
ncbi:MAG: LytTR family DNA-binding domain-containing protein [Odoribacter sp.]